MIPTLYIENWSSRLRGPSGKAYTIMARPRRWEHGAGTVLALVPDPADLLALWAGDMLIDDYRARYMARIPAAIGPGELLARAGRRRTAIVADGDTLCCGCSKASAAAGQCHRVWAAAALLSAGWGVVLDGEVLSR